jgi:glycerol kinase
VFDRSGKAVSSAQQEFPQIFPGPGHVEHDPEDIWSTQLATAKEAIARAGISALDLAAIGVTNQRETTVLWEKATGKPIANAIVWQSRVTAPICDRLKAAGHEATFRKKTGLVVDAYFPERRSSTCSIPTTACAIAPPAARSCSARSIRS